VYGNRVTVVTHDRQIRNRAEAPHCLAVFAFKNPNSATATPRALVRFALRHESRNNRELLVPRRNGSGLCGGL
jgi:hypothetical protein